MTDKVQKILEEVIRMHNLLPVMDGDNISINYADRICTTLEMYIDSLQKEPVSIWHNMDEVPVKGEVILVQTKDTFYGVSVQKGGTTYKNKNKDRYVKWAYASDLLNLSNVERTVKNRKELVSEDLEEAIDTYLKSYWGGEKEKQDWPFLKKMAIYFTEWQKEQFEKNRLKHCNSITNKQAELEQGFIDQHLDKYQRIPTFLDAIEYGMRLKEQQMMAKAVDGKVIANGMGNPILHLWDKGRHLIGKKVKVIVIKEG